MCSGMALEDSQVEVALHVIFTIVFYLFFQIYQGFISKGPSMFHLERPKE